MKTTKILYGCFILLLFSCGPNQEDLATREKLVQAEEVEAMEADLIQQQVEMDSMAAIQEIEIAQQIVLNQQLMDLRTKMASAESGLNADLDPKQTLNQPH